MGNQKQHGLHVTDTEPTTRGEPRVLQAALLLKYVLQFCILCPLGPWFDLTNGHAGKNHQGVKDKFPRLAAQNVHPKAGFLARKKMY